MVVGVIIWHLGIFFGMRAGRNARMRPICTREHVRELEHGRMNHSDDPKGFVHPHQCGALVPCVREAAASPRGTLRDGRTSPAHLRAGSRSHVTSHGMASYHDTVGIPGTCRRTVAWSVGRMSCIRARVPMPVESAARWGVERKPMLHRLQSNGCFLVRSESRTSTKCSHRSMGSMRTSPQRGVTSTSA